MSSPDMFELDDSPLSPSYPRSSGASQSCTPPTPTPNCPSPTPPTPTCTPNLQSLVPVETGRICHRIKVEFLDYDGVKIKSQSSSNQEVISIVSSILKSNSSEYSKSTVKKFCKADLFKDLIVEEVLGNISNQFQNFLSKDDCPMKAGDVLSDPEAAADVDFDVLLQQCFSECPSLVNALCIISSGCDNYEQLKDSSKKYERQRLLALVAICSFTRNQKINLYQRYAYHVLNC